MKTLLAVSLMLALSSIAFAEVADNGGDAAPPRSGDQSTLSPEMSEYRRIHDDSRSRYQAFYNCYGALGLRDNGIPFKNPLTWLPNPTDNRAILLPYQGGSGFYGLREDGVFKNNLTGIERDVIEGSGSDVYQSQRHFFLVFGGTQYGGLTQEVERNTIRRYTGQPGAIPPVEGERDTSPQYSFQFTETFNEVLENGISWLKNTNTAGSIRNEDVVEDQLRNVYCQCRQAAFLEKKTFLDALAGLPETFVSKFSEDGGLNCDPLVARNF